ncbi:MAG: hypothetical protein AAGJ83_09710, partial [Planctomycetota bacterium]
MRSSQNRFEPQRKLTLLRTWFLVLTAIVSFLSASNTAADGRSKSTLFQTKLLPALRTYCFDCHDAGSEIELHVESAQDLQQARSKWQQAIAHLRLGTMPPQDGPELDSDTRQRMIEWIDQLNNAVDCANNPNAGRVALRRLNRIEYRNTIRDLM